VTCTTSGQSWPRRGCPSPANAGSSRSAIRTRPRRSWRPTTALPCRISVYEEFGITKLATIKPTALIALYATPDLKAVAEDVEATLERIMSG